MIGPSSQNDFDTNRFSTSASAASALATALLSTLATITAPRFLLNFSRSSASPTGLLRIRSVSSRALRAVIRAKRHFDTNAMTNLTASVTGGR